MADQLWLMKRIREEEEEVSNEIDYVNVHAYFLLQPAHGLG